MNRTSAELNTPDSQSHPAWLPVPVRAWIDANRDHPEHVAGADLIHHLATSPHMKKLWTELTKRKPIGFVYPVVETALAKLIEPPLPDDVDELHWMGLVLVFKEILRIATSLYAAKSEAQRAAQADDLRRRAGWLRTEADDTDLIPLGAGDIDWRIVAAGMRAKADVLDQTADAIGVYRLIVANERDNLTGIGTAWRISASVRAIFGQPLYRQSAAIASMLTGESVTVEQVRDIARKYPTHVTFASKSSVKSPRVNASRHGSK
jgi:hypothetical protein